jgi:hypothetical protein
MKAIDSFRLANVSYSGQPLAIEPMAEAIVAALEKLLGRSIDAGAGCTPGPGAPPREGNQ